MAEEAFPMTLMGFADSMIKKVFLYGAGQGEVGAAGETKWEWHDTAYNSSASGSHSAVSTTSEGTVVHPQTLRQDPQLVAAESVAQVAERTHVLSKAAKKRRKKKKKAASAGPHVRWGNVEELLFSRNVSFDGVPRSGTHPLGLGELQAKVYCSVDESVLAMQRELRERALKLGLNTEGELESRQWDFRKGIRNPLFGALDEEERAVIALNFDVHHQQGVRDMKVSSPTTCAMHVQQDRPGYILTVVLQHELDVIRKSRFSSGGCSCKPLKSLDKLSVKKLKTELSARTTRMPTDLDGLTKAELIKSLKQSLRTDTAMLCSSDMCECQLAGVPCHADTCGCHCGLKPGQLQHCANPFGSTRYSAKDVRRYRRSILRPDEPPSDEEKCMEDATHSPVTETAQIDAQEALNPQPDDVQDKTPIALNTEDALPAYAESCSTSDYSLAQTIQDSNTSDAETVELRSREESPDTGRDLQPESQRQPQEPTNIPDHYPMLPLQAPINTPHPHPEERSNAAGADVSASALSISEHPRTEVSSSSAKAAAPVASRKAIENNHSSADPNSLNRPTVAHRRPFEKPRGEKSPASVTSQPSPAAARWRPKRKETECGKGVSFVQK